MLARTNSSPPHKVWHFPSNYHIHYDNLTKTVGEFTSIVCSDLLLQHEKKVSPSEHFYSDDFYLSK